VKGHPKKRGRARHVVPLNGEGLPPANWFLLLADDFANGVDYGFGRVDLNVVAASLDDQSRAVRGEARQLFLHLAPLTVDRFRHVSGKLHLIGVVGKHHERQIAERAKGANLRGAFVLGRRFRPDRGKELPPAEDGAELRPNIGWSGSGREKPRQADGQRELRVAYSMR
jgi:hypothetical protein